MVDFNQTFDRIMGHEGGYVNNPNDPGGETNWGISKRAYPNEDIKAMTKEKAKVIFKRDFWDVVNADKLISKGFDGVAYALSDFAYNSGPQTAVRYFQRTVGVADDGHWGPASQAACEKMTESDLLMGLAAERLDFMTKLNNWPNAGKGWARRIAMVLRHGVMDSD